MPDTVNTKSGALSVRVATLKSKILKGGFSHN